VFVNRTGSAELEPLRTMASDWVTRGLSRNPMMDVFEVGGLYLAGRVADGAPADPRALARANGAGLVVAGNFYRAGDSLMFSAQVIDVESGRVRQAIDPVSGSFEDPLTAVENVRQRVTAALATLLDPRAGIGYPPALVPPRYDAFETFIAGQDRYWKGDWAGALPSSGKPPSWTPTSPWRSPIWASRASVPLDATSPTPCWKRCPPDSVRFPSSRC
jgi:TolB-like protein